MAHRSRTNGSSRRRSQASTEAPTFPEGDVPTTTGTARLERDPDRPRAFTVVVNDVPSSYVDLDDPGFLAFEYMQQMAALVDLLDGPLEAVHLGAAGCALPRYIDHTRRGSRQLGVDVDAVLMERVREWFDLPRSPRLRLRAGDARAAVATLRDGSADLVVRDVFDGATTPPHLTTVEATDDVLRVLRDDGIYLVNCADRPPLAGLASELATLRAAGLSDEHVAVVAEPALFKRRRYGNFVVAASRVHTFDDAALGRALRTQPVPAHLVTGPGLEALRGTAAPRHDDPGP
ncbi:spermidine synthase, partial [Paraoerskovia marina]|uniref:spermidine synthase n=1 Tax=Paraoerskovia marina TaxID=545619 RepID=UPI0004929D09